MYWKEGRAAPAAAAAAAAEGTGEINENINLKRYQINQTLKTNCIGRRAGPPPPRGAAFAWPGTKRVAVAVGELVRL